jgi:hypothetical protein
MFLDMQLLLLCLALKNPSLYRLKKVLSFDVLFAALTISHSSSTSCLNNLLRAFFIDCPFGS